MIDKHAYHESLDIYYILKKNFKGLNTDIVMIYLILNIFKFINPGFNASEFTKSFDLNHSKEQDN